jgi:phosphopantothenoylcysteine decarboxylase/phosphopantothenate--cysteine ligase
LSVFSGKKILLGVSGGIAAYKAAELVRLLVTEGAIVQVVMTEAATQFITPLTLEALSGSKVHRQLFDPLEESAMSHIDLARWADLILIAPASADLLARLRGGHADDLLTTLCLATNAPLWVAPAMNRVMWEHPATKENIDTLKSRGVHLLGPDQGIQACGESGPGRLLEPGLILQELEQSFGGGPWAGLRLLISAGPTREPIDPVRYLSNRSSGKMGYALAQAAQQQGAFVTLISGPTALSPPKVDQFIEVETAKDMLEAVLHYASSADMFIGSAAVADYAPIIAPQKIKKETSTLTLELYKTVDIIGQVSALDDRPFTVGFAAETENLEAHAQLKLKHKALDLIAANQVGDHQGFEVDDNELMVFWEGGQRFLPRAQKTQLAAELLTLILERYHASHST